MMNKGEEEHRRSTERDTRGRRRQRKTKKDSKGRRRTEKDEERQGLTKDEEGQRRTKNGREGRFELATMIDGR